MRALVHVAALAALTLSLAACANEVTAPPKSVADSAVALIIPRPPHPPIDPQKFVSIVAGAEFTCASKHNGNVYCWGLDNEYQSGGTGSSACSLWCAYQPRLVLTGAGPQLTAGRDHACVIKGGGIAFCWGAGGQGQLGDQNGVYTSQGPVAVAGGNTFSTIGAGSTSTCGITAGGLLCWGTFGHGANTPQLITTPAFNISSLAVTDFLVCAIDVSGTYGTPRCRGRNDYGEGGQALSQSKVDFRDVTRFGSAAMRFSLEEDYICVDQNPKYTVECAGLNNEGQLGNGNTSTTDKPQTVGGAMVLTNVTTNEVHACALDTTNHAFCWGNGNNGQLGNGVFGRFSTPQAVNTTMTFRALAAGRFHTCGIGTDNHIYCWGRNHFGNLGIRDPRDVVYMLPVQAIDP